MKFFEPGHSFMSADVMHANIENVYRDTFKEEKSLTLNFNT